MNIILLAISAALVNNVILSQFMGICPFLGVSKKVSTAAGMGGAVIFVITIASIVANGSDKCDLSFRACATQAFVSEHDRVYLSHCSTCTVRGDVLKEDDSIPV